MLCYNFKCGKTRSFIGSYLSGQVNADVVNSSVFT